MSMFDRLWCSLFHRRCVRHLEGSDLWRIEQAEIEIRLAIQEADLNILRERKLSNELIEYLKKGGK